MTKALVRTASFSHPIRALPTDVPYGVLRILVWDTFSERGASGTWCSGPYGDNRDEWWPRGVPRDAVRLKEARWEFDGFNLTAFELGYHQQGDEADEELWSLCRQLDEYATRKGWKP